MRHTHSQPQHPVVAVAHQGIGSQNRYIIFGFADNFAAEFCQTAFRLFQTQSPAPDHSGAGRFFEYTLIVKVNLFGALIFQSYFGSNAPQERIVDKIKVTDGRSFDACGQIEFSARGSKAAVNVKILFVRRAEYKPRTVESGSKIGCFDGFRQLEIFHLGIFEEDFPAAVRIYCFDDRAIFPDHRHLAGCRSEFKNVQPQRSSIQITREGVKRYRFGHGKNFQSRGAGGHIVSEFTAVGKTNAQQQYIRNK